MSQATISKIERGDQEQSVHTPILSATLGISSLWLATGETSDTETTDQYTCAENRRAYNLPLPGTPQPKFMAREKLRLLTLTEIADPTCQRNIQQQIPPGFSEFCDLIPFESSENAYCYQIPDQSTWPDYRLNEIVLIDPEITATNGDDAIVVTPDGNAHFKRLHITKEGLYLETINPNWPPPRISKAPEGTTIDGVATGSWLSRINRELP